MMKSRSNTITLCLLAFLLIPSLCIAQGSVGLPFLKIGVGARQAGLGQTFTGVADDIFTLYTNPGGLGHLRRWQWAASYNRWFADIYQANLSLAKQYRIIGSRKTTLGAFATYLGMPSWDSTGGLEDPVSASHLVGGISVAQRLDWLSQALSLGVTLKGIYSNFEGYTAKAIAADVGMLFRSPRFRLGPLGLGIFEYGIISMGVSMLHIGQEMTFDSRSSVLPRTLCSGLSLRIGKYKTWNWLFASDFLKSQGRDLLISLGVEMWWKEILGIRAGYRFNHDDLGELGFGLSLRWDDVFSTLFKMPTRYGDALQIDIADAGYGEVLSQTYRGTLSHFPVAPEHFILEEPLVVNAWILGESSVVTLTWEKAQDPDPFDKVAYLVMINRDKAVLDKAIYWVERNMNEFLGSFLKDSLMVCEKTRNPYYSLDVSEGGVYYWAVAAYDLAGHARLAKRGRERISEFVVSTSDLMVDAVDFAPMQWITTTPEQGLLTFRLGNRGVARSDSFRFAVYDSLITGPDFPGGRKKILYEERLAGLGAGQDTTLTLLWNTAKNGMHSITASAHPDSWTLELDRENNDSTAFFVTIPKGILDAPDTLEVRATGYDMTDIPLVPEIYFAPFSSAVDSFYFDNRGVLPSILPTLAQRLQNNPQITLQILGSIDALSGESDEGLADDRAGQVKGLLVLLGAPASQLNVIKEHPERILGQRSMPANPDDARWVMQQYRRVIFRSDEAHQATVFEPYRVAVDTTVRHQVVFRTSIVSAGRINTWAIEGQPANIRLSDRQMAAGDSIRGEMVWNATDQKGNLIPRDAWYRYMLVMQDTLGRSFMTYTDSLYLKEKVTIRRREMFGAAQFARAEPVYQFYWDRLMDVARELIENPDMRLQFEGHACSIGSYEVNERLSHQRARLFTNTFLERLKSTFPEHYTDVAARLASPTGFGEMEPLRLKLRGQPEVLLGDNEHPVGRYMNRRIMVLLIQEH